MDYEPLDLHHRARSRDPYFRFDYVWVDREISLDRHDYENSEIEYIRRDGDGIDVDPSMEKVAIPRWVRTIELKLSTGPKTEISHHTLLRLASLRVGRVIERRKIWRGYLDTVRSEQLVTESRTPNAYFALISTGYGSLVRENHGFGYHYHYSSDGVRRADILFTFSRKPTDPLKPATWEPHAIRKADFTARVTRWGHKKRQSVHDALVSDLCKRCITDYLQPGKSHQFLMP